MWSGLFCLCTHLQQSKELPDPSLRLNTWKCRCQSLPQRGKPSISVAEHAYTQSEGVIPAPAKPWGHAAAWRWASRLHVHGRSQSLVSYKPLCTPCSCKLCCVLKLATWKLLELCSCHGIGVLLWDFGGATSLFDIRIWKHFLPLLLIQRLWILIKTFGLQLYNVLSDRYFLQETSGEKNCNLVCSVFWSFWLKGRVDLDL